MKAEGIADLPRPGRMIFPTKARLVVVFDNDGKSTHMPGRVQTLRVFRRDDRDGTEPGGWHLPSGAADPRLKDHPPSDHPE